MTSSGPTSPSAIEARMLAELPSAGLPRRIGAMIYDALLVIAMALTTTGLLNLFAPRPVIPEGAESVSLEGMQTVSGPLLSGILLLQTFAFFAFFWIVHGRTLGMQAWRLRLVDAQGAHITLTQAIQRFLVAVPALGLGFLGYLWRFVDTTGLTWPDRASGSRIVTLPRSRPH